MNELLETAGLRDVPRIDLPATRPTYQVINLADLAPPHRDRDIPR